MARIDRFQTQIADILEEFGTEVGDALGEVIEQVAKESKKDLAAASPKSSGKRSGAYAKGWRTEDTGTRLGPGQTIYNTKPGLPHLLEFGHAKRGGGRVAGIPHIQAINDKIPEMIEKRLKEKL